jgi:hypothetical protein
MLQHETYRPAPAGAAGANATPMNGVISPRPTQMPTSNYAEWYAPSHLCRHSAHRASHLHRDWARPCHICTGTWLTPAHICTGTGLAPCHICTGTGLVPCHLCTGTGGPGGSLPPTPSQLAGSSIGIRRRTGIPCRMGFRADFDYAAVDSPNPQTLPPKRTNAEPKVRDRRRATARHGAARPSSSCGHGACACAAQGAGGCRVGAGRWKGEDIRRLLYVARCKLLVALVCCVLRVACCMFVRVMCRPAGPA